MTTQRSEAPWMSDLPAYIACMTSCLTPRRLSLGPYVYLAKLSRPYTSLSTRPWKMREEWRYNSTHSKPRHYIGWVVGFIPRPSTHWTGGLVQLQAILGAVDRGRMLPPFRNRNTNFPFVQPAAYVLSWLSYSGSVLTRWGQWTRCCITHNTNPIRSYVGVLPARVLLLLQAKTP